MNYTFSNLCCGKNSYLAFVTNIQFINGKCQVLKNISKTVWVRAAVFLMILSPKQEASVPTHRLVKESPCSSVCLFCLGNPGIHSQTSLLKPDTVQERTVCHAKRILPFFKQFFFFSRFHSAFAEFFYLFYK